MSFHAQLKFVVDESSAASGTAVRVPWFGAPSPRGGACSRRREGGMATVGDMVSARRPLATSTASVLSFVVAACAATALARFERALIGNTGV